MAFDMSSIAETLKKKLSKTDPSLAAAVNMGTNLPDPMTGPCIEMPPWFQEATNVKGLYFGRIMMVAGPSDTGKTSAAIIAMKCAQEQDCAIIYVETEKKTTVNDLESWGVDPSKILLIQDQVAERAWEAMLQAVDVVQGKDSKTKILCVFDSVGNVVSQRDESMNMVEDSSKPGGKGQINRLGINKMVLKMNHGSVSFFIVNYTYDNIGSHGKTNAGGQAINLFSSMTYQTSRVKWLEKTVDGKKIRKGAVVKYSLYKNHLNKTNPGLKEFFLKITSEGIELVDGTGE